MGALRVRNSQPWLAVFPRERLHFVTDLDFSQSAAGAIQDLYGSLGLDAASLLPPRIGVTTKASTRSGASAGCACGCP